MQYVISISVPGSRLFVGTGESPRSFWVEDLDWTRLYLSRLQAELDIQSYPLLFAGTNPVILTLDEAVVSSIMDS